MYEDEFDAIVESESAKAWGFIDELKSVDVDIAFGLTVVMQSPSAQFASAYGL